MQFGEIEKERNKIKRKKNKKERKKQLFQNTVEKMALVIKLLNMCFKHYKNIYCESDYYRTIKIVELIDSEQARIKTMWSEKKDQIMSSMKIQAEKELEQVLND